MHTRTTLAVAGMLLAITACSSVSEYTVEDCQKAITDESSKTNRPKECQDLSQKDYDLIMSHWVVKKTLEDMPQDDQDVLDLYDDGEVNGSLTDG